MHPSGSSPLKDKYVTIDRMNDLNEVVVRLEGRQFTVSLAHVATFSQWPRIDDKDVDSLRNKIRQFIKDELIGQEVYLQLNKDAEEKTTPEVFLSWTANHVSEKRQWFGKAPSQQIGWGMININVLLVEKGYSIYLVNDQPPDEKTALAFQEAERLAQKASAGIWSIKNLGSQIKSSGISKPLSKEAK